MKSPGWDHRGWITALKNKLEAWLACENPAPYCSTTPCPVKSLWVVSVLWASPARVTAVLPQTYLQT